LSLQLHLCPAFFFVLYFLFIEKPFSKNLGVSEAVLQGFAIEHNYYVAFTANLDATGQTRTGSICYASFYSHVETGLCL
jgi:hypothetical protein